MQAYSNLRSAPSTENRPFVENNPFIGLYNFQAERNFSSHSGFPRTPTPRFVKRFLDIVLGSFLIVLFSPVFLLLGIAVWVDSPGGVIYLQQRIGRGGKAFTLYKFRSMIQLAEVNGPQLSMPGDIRITRIGRLMRRYWLDELPQLLNVLLGDMSLVGPRPERAFYVRQIMTLAPEYRDLLTIRPGITGLAQIKNGYTYSIESMLDRLAYDSIYLANQSLKMDILILWQTLKLFLQGRGY